MNSSPVISVQPISLDMQQQVCQEVERYLLLAQSLYRQSFDPIEVCFNLKGKTAGMYKVSFKARTRFFGASPPEDVQRVIRFNPWLFAKYPADSWDNTIPHEVAHYIVECLYGLRKTRPHGVEWRQVMADFGAQPLVRAAYDLSGIPVRQVRRYAYQCGCREVLLSAHRHRKIVQGRQSYRCRDCHGELTSVAHQN